MKIPFFEIEFNREAGQANPEQWPILQTELTTGNYTDILVLSHGWNNDMAEAKDLYANLLGLIQNELSKKDTSGKKFIAVNIFWPSKKFADKDLISGGAAAIGTIPEADQLIEQCDALALTVESSEEKRILANLSDALKGTQDEDYIADQFTELFNSIAKSGNKTEEDTLEPVEVSVVKSLLKDPNQGNVSNVNQDGGAASALSAIGDSIRNLLNLTTYYKMKERAGIVGKNGLNPVLHQITDISKNAAIHMIGHSFGARLVTAAVFGNDTKETYVEVKSLLLLQAAFSHYSFADQYDNQNNGYFRNVIVKNLVQGAVLITHTRNDKAVGIAYALASRLAGQVASAIGDKDSLYGGLGGNGAQKTPGVLDNTLLSAGQSYDFKPGRIYNLGSDEFISGHSDIRKPEVAHALVTAFLI